MFRREACWTQRDRTVDAGLLTTRLPSRPLRMGEGRSSCGALSPYPARNEPNVGSPEH